MTGYLKQVLPAGAALHFQYDPEQCELSGGVGGWSEIARPRVTAGTEYTGTPLLKLSFVLMLDGYATGTSVEPTIKQLYGWGVSPGSDKDPAILQLVYATYSKLRWVLNDVQVSNTLRREDGQRVQAQVTVTLLEYQGLTGKATAADSVRAGIISITKTPVTRTYTVKKGDNGKAIAHTQLGNSNRWPDIAKLNGISKDPYHLKVGLKLKLPPK